MVETAMVTMVRNEAAIIERTLEHALCFFDRVFVADHLSDDGTKDLLEAKAAQHPEQLRVFHYCDEQYEQRSLMNALADLLVDEFEEVEWITSLDADEFFAFEDRKAFHDHLVQQRKLDAFTLRWKNCLPADMSTPKGFLGSWLIPPEFAFHGKVFLRARCLRNHKYELAQGNHFLVSARNGEKVFPPVTGHIYHLPIRDRDHLRLKVTQGVLTYASMGRDRQEGEGKHWFDLFDRMRGPGLTDDELNHVILSYSEPGDLSVDAVSLDQLLTRGFVKREVLVKYMPEKQQILTSMDQAQQLVRSVEGLRSIGYLDGMAADRLLAKWGLEAQGNRIGSQLQSNHKEWPGLGPREFNAPRFSPPAVKQTMLEACAWPIETLTKTQWGHLIPLTFALFSVLRPRVYVELGVMHGASFFAACQSLRRQDNGGVAIAVDSWRGDFNVGFYNEKVFTNFQYLLKHRYAAIGRYIRADFQEANQQGLRGRRALRSLLLRSGMAAAFP